MSTLRLPIMSPPGSATRASPQRASNGPSTLNDARMRVTSSYGASGDSVADASISTTLGAGFATVAPTARSRSLITSRSATGGMLRNVVTPGASNAAAICFTPEFFVAPATSTRPTSGPFGRTRKRVTRSRALVLGCTRLDDCGDGLAHVVGAQADALLLGFVHEPVGDGQARARVDGALRTLHRERRLRGDRRGQRGDVRLEILGVDEAVAEADPVRLVRVDLRRGPDQLLRLARAHDAREPLRAAEVGQDPVLVLEQPHLRSACEHADVTRERELQAGAQCVPVHGRDRRVPRVGEPGVGLLRAEDAVDGGIGVP